MRSRCQSVGKEAPLYTDNEDAYLANDTGAIWAVADGAGGTGVYAGEWARHLVHHVSTAPINEVGELTDWVDAHWEFFFNRYELQAQTNYLIEQKFMQEGSSATLASLHYHQNKVHWMAYGDAVALCFQPTTNELWASTMNLRQFTTAPYLINWQTALAAEGFLSGVWLHKPGQQYALLSDALGQYVLMAYASLQNDKTPLLELAQQSHHLGRVAQTHINYWSTQSVRFDQAVWFPLHAALTSAEHFLEYTQFLRRQQLLSSDDYTCVLLED